MSDFPGIVETRSRGHLEITIPAYREIWDHCSSCGTSLDPQNLAPQVETALAARYFRMRLTPELQCDIVRFVFPWWHRFRRGHDVCFCCAVAYVEAPNQALATKIAGIFRSTKVIVGEFT